MRLPAASIAILLATTPVYAEPSSEIFIWPLPGSTIDAAEREACLYFTFTNSELPASASIELRNFAPPVSTLALDRYETIFWPETVLVLAGTPPFWADADAVSVRMSCLIDRTEKRVLEVKISPGSLVGEKIAIQNNSNELITGSFGPHEINVGALSSGGRY